MKLIILLMTITMNISLKLKSFYNINTILKQKYYKNYKLYSNAYSIDELVDHTTITPIESSSNVKKTKVVLVCGYIGTNYYGLQYSSQPNLQTIESEIESALHKIGCIIDSNHLNISKLGWSRSSRTDKGVHAARLIISAKLEVKYDWIVNNNRIPIIPKKLNEILPNDIRIYSCMKVSNSFCARTDCNWRQYEYLLPVESINNNKSTEENISLLNSLLNKYIGSHSFHNFHKVQRKNLVSNHKFADDNDDNDNDEDSDEIINDYADNNIKSNKKVSLYEEIKSIYINEIKDVNIEPYSKEFYSNSNINYNERLIVSKTYTIIYYCNIDEVVTVNNNKYYKIIIRGNSFLLNQIRLMIGAVAAIATEKLPDYIINLALNAPFHILFPIAPAEGLLLVDTGVNSRFQNRQKRSLHRFITGYNDIELNLMTDEEYHTSEEFKHDNIYKEIDRKWHSLTNYIENDNDILVNNWENRLNYINPPNQLISAYSLVYPKLLQYYNENEIIVSQYNKKNILRNILDYKNAIIDKNYRTKINPLKLKHNDFLPEGISTALAIYYKTVPSISITKALITLATIQLNEGLPLVNYDCNEVINYIENNGGLEVISTLKKHPNFII